MDKKTIYTNDFTSIIYLVMFFVGGFILGKLFIRDFETLNTTYLLLAIFCFTVLGLATIYQIVHIRCYKLLLEEDTLTLRYWIDGLFPRGEFSFPVWDECAVHLKDIEYIMLHNADYVKNMLINLGADVDMSRFNIPTLVDYKVSVLCIVEASGTVHLVNASFYSSRAMSRFVELLVNKNDQIRLIKSA